MDLAREAKGILIYYARASSLPARSMRSTPCHPLLRSHHELARCHLMIENTGLMTSGIHGTTVNLRFGQTSTGATIKGLADRMLTGKDVPWAESLLSGSLSFN